MQASTNSEIFNIKARAKQANVFKYSSRQVNSKKLWCHFHVSHMTMEAWVLLVY